MLKPKNGGKNQRTKIFTICSGTLSQSIGRGRISREGSLVVRESRERRDNIFDEKNAIWPEILNRKQQFSMGNFHLVGRTRATFEGGL